ncbi:MAG TPA: SDR family oxidoreductase [Acidocella sp.]|jgi:NAD(P)-dependent dehydrogenase (short-subunit alcohol dehydrogenase family)|uniref:SDR family oxidoreductase n=1 Tax=Acidocella sp. TaxID=50710 RepID=UPI002CE6A7E2|nr:SDR family oxidoreductase [Acidocella sp.]HVE21741.1 SDR family oxidoreductase [Acidocella sp.]
MSKQIAIVTGAGTGVGRAAALALLGAGWHVALAGRRQEALEATAAMSPSGTALVVPTDVTDPDEVGQLFERVHAAYGRLDLLFNNAGGNVPATNFGDMTWEQWKSVREVNLDGMFLCANAAFRMMRDQTPQGGRIVNNGSISAHAPRPHAAAYTTTKHAVTGLTKSISLDGRKFNIACGQIDIGNAATPMTERMTTGVLQPDGRMMQEPRMDVADVGRTLLFMASMPPDANVQFVTVMATNMPFIGRG